MSVGSEGTFSDDMVYIVKADYVGVYIMREIFRNMKRSSCFQFVCDFSQHFYCKNPS